MPWGISTGCSSLLSGLKWVPIWHRIWESGSTWPTGCQFSGRPRFSESSASVWWPWPSQVCSLSRGDRELTLSLRSIRPAKKATWSTREKSLRSAVELLKASSSLFFFPNRIWFCTRQSRWRKIYMNSKLSSDHLLRVRVSYYFHYVDSILTTTITNLMQCVCFCAFCFNDDIVGAY